MTVACYGAVAMADAAPLRRTGVSAQMVVAVAAVAALLVASVLVSQQVSTTALVQVRQPALHQRQQAKTNKLLGFDPFTSNSQPGKGGSSTLGAFEFDENERQPLPQWATEWSDENHNTCAPGAQCDHGNLPNPLGTLGRWVMIKTSSHFNSPYDEYRRHKCANLPGWALEECHRMRDKESTLDEEGNPADGSEAKARPMLLHEYRMQPAVRRALPARWQHMRRSHISLAKQSAQ